jgi:transposase
MRPSRAFKFVGTFVGIFFLPDQRIQYPSGLCGLLRFLSNARVWIVAGHTDMRKGFGGLAAMAQTTLAANPFCGHVFRGKRGDILRVLWFDGQRLMPLAKRLEHSRFVWPQARSGSVSLTRAQLSIAVGGIDWRMPVWVRSRSGTKLRFARRCLANRPSK